MATGNLFGIGGESNSLYGNSLSSGTPIQPSSFIYFEWFIFKTSASQPATPTGGSWNFLTNTGTAPTGWTSTVSGIPLDNLWFSIAFVDSRSPTNIVWSTPGLISATNSVYSTAYADTFTGDGVDTTWTLTQDPVVVNNLDVSINGVTQVPVVDYTISGTTFTTTTPAPLNSIILVKYRQALPNSYFGTANNVGYTPHNWIAATNVQAALDEVADDISAIDGVSGSNLVGYLPDGTGAVGSTVQDKLRQTVSVADFGADPTGVADSTAAIVAALATGKDVMLPDGTYKLAPTAAQTIANQGYQRLYGEGSVTLSVNLASSINLFNFDGPVALENLAVDFNNSYCQNAFVWRANAGHIQVKNVRFSNLKDTNNLTGSATLYVVPTGNTFEIEHIKASSMLKRGNNVITDGPGQYSFIYVGGGSSSTQGAIRNVFVSEIHNIDASDQIMFEDTSAIYIATDSSDQNNRIEIDNIQGYNFGKRLVKTQASNVSVSNLMGNSTEEDSFSVISIQSDTATIGDKYGCSVTNVVGYGKMAVVVDCNAPGAEIRNVVGQIGPAALASPQAETIRVAGNDTLVDGVWSNSQRDIAIGSGVQIVKNLTLRNITLVIGSNKLSGATIYNRSDTLGFDGLLIDGVYATVDASAAVTAPIWLYDFLNGTTKKGRNLVIKNVVVQSNGILNQRGAILRFIENVSIESFKYVNTSGLSHFRIIEIISCSNVNVDDVIIEGVNQVGVNVSACTGRNTINRVYNPDTSSSVVNNANSSDVTVMNCDTTKVLATTTPAWQNSKMTFGTTANRPTVGRTPYFTQYLDTTLGKPIWWDGANWKDSAGTTV